MKTLHLVLKGVWYDKINRGEKTCEYRECKNYWNTRFARADCTAPCPYDKVRFRRGYAANAPTMEFEIQNISICNESNDLNLPECWAIKLGRRLKWQKHTIPSHCIQPAAAWCAYGVIWICHKILTLLNFAVKNWQLRKFHAMEKIFMPNAAIAS